MIIIFMVMCNVLTIVDLLNYQLYNNINNNNHNTLTLHKMNYFYNNYSYLS